MPSQADLMSRLRQQLRTPPTQYSVQTSLPVLFFGDALTARVATIGLNPSKREYLDQNGVLLSGSEQRFASTRSLGVRSRRKLTDAQADDAIEVMRCYFDAGKPVYGSYFGHLTHFLAGMGASYANGSATHLDLVQEATDPVWKDLSLDGRAALLERDLPFLIWQLQNLPRLKCVICAGKTVSDHVQAGVHVQIKKKGQMKRIRWWRGIAHLGRRELQIGGWHLPLNQPTGLGTAGEIELGKLFARELL